MSKNNKHSKAKKLLLDYRPALWRRSALEAVPGMSQEVLRACKEQISFTQALVEVLRNNEPMGEKLYRIIHAAYMTDKQPGGVEETLDHIAKSYKPIPRRTYFRLKVLAVDILDNHLVMMAKESALSEFNTMFSLGNQPENI